MKRKSAASRLVAVEEVAAVAGPAVVEAGVNMAVAAVAEGTERADVVAMEVAAAAEVAVAAAESAITAISLAGTWRLACRVVGDLNFLKGGLPA